MIAFRNVLSKIPPSAVDEETIAKILKKKGYKLKYCPEAIVYNKQPTILKDVIKQRRRINVGHLSLKREGYIVATYNLFNIFKALIKNFELKKIGYIFLAINLEIYIRFLSFYDTYVKRRKHFIWEMVCSTKDIKNESH